MFVNKLIKTLLFMVDTSCNMLGTPSGITDNLSNLLNGGIGAVNGAIDSVVMETRKVLNSPIGETNLLNISTLEFSKTSIHISPPEDITKYLRKDINANNCDSEISKAFNMLDNALSNGEIVSDCNKLPNLAIILIATQRFEDGWETSLNKLFCNKLFGCSIRRAVVFGNEIGDAYPTTDSLLLFTSGVEYDSDGELVTKSDGTYKNINHAAAVVRRNDAELLRRAIIQESMRVVELLLGINKNTFGGVL